LHRRDNESVREYDRQRWKNNRERRRKGYLNTVRWRKRNPLGYKAHTSLGYAIRSGKIKRQPCEKCGHVKSHGHHEDYNQPLNVIWLCAVCHQRHHHQREA
jgi:hypothetical protein